MFPGAVGARTAFRMPASRLSDVSRRRPEREIRFNRNAIRTRGYPQRTFAKEYFGCWVVTSVPLLTSAKWVAYGTEVSVGNVHDVFVKVSALLVLMKVMSSSVIRLTTSSTS